MRFSTIIFLIFGAMISPNSLSDSETKLIISVEESELQPKKK